MRIQHNIMAMNAYRNYTNNVSAMQKNLEKLSSGYKINRAGDDAAGLAISEKMRAQITGLETAQKNAKDGISLVQTAEGALTEVHDMLNRMAALATQSANGTYDDTTDRVQMQKEVNQLLDEINRIADSSNFNGINLLDGTLGLNTEAFSFSTADAVAANDGTINLSSYLAPSTTAPDALHLEEASATGTNPGATIDLNTLKIKVSGKASSATKAIANVKFIIGGTTYTAKLSNTTSTAVAKSTSDIATALRKAMTEENSAAVKKADGTHDGTTAANNDSIKIGDAVYSVGGTGAEITLTFEGYFKGGTYVKKSATAGDFTADQAEAFNTGLGMTVKLDGITNGEVSEGTFVHDTTKVDQAVAKKAESLAGIDMTLDANLVKNNNILEIDGTKFQFKTTATSFTADNSATLIDVSKYDKDDQVHAAVDLLSKQTVTGQDSRTWKIASKNGDTIHFEQIAKSDSGKELDTYAKLTNLISAKGEATSAKNIGTNIEIDNAKVAEGNTLNIDGVKYVFTENTSGKRDTADTKYVKFTKGGSDAATNLQSKVNGSTINTAKDTVTVRAATSDGKAPVVLGKGLTLQIGDTSDDFNQLNVAVYDCHADSIGVGGLDISTEEAAQSAIKNIKDAINFVSDVRGTLGATQNRLDHTINNLSVMTENIQDAESTIRDTDVAEEMMAYTKNNILIQSAQAMLAQANQVPQGVLQLLQ